VNHVICQQKEGYIALPEYFSMMHSLLIYSFCYFGLTGCVVVGLTTLYTSLGYSGKARERFSPGNHFISELGEIGVSSRARIFNFGLMISGVSLIPFVIGLGLYLQNTWAKLGILAGLWTAIACFCVGFFPMNNISPHIKAAIAYFRGGLVTILLFNLAILAQPGGQVLIPEYALIPGALAVVAYGSFLILAAKMNGPQASTSSLDPQQMPERPRFWLLPVVEWAVFFSTIIWFFCIALILFQKVHGS
jgi:hypothetical protein